MGGVPPKEATRADLELAKLVLSRAYVIITDKGMYTRTLTQTGEHLGIRISSEDVKKVSNKNRKKPPTILPAQRKRAAELNNLDMELYEHCLSITKQERFAPALVSTNVARSGIASQHPQAEDAMQETQIDRKN